MQLVAQPARDSPSGQSAQFEKGKKCTPGTPLATGALFATRPVSAIPMCVVPWKPPWKATTSPRPVAILHNLIAASTAFAPVGPQKCTFVRPCIPTGSIDS
jgi:hypothetical protein